jgi:hypothetical protein
MTFRPNIPPATLGHIIKPVFTDQRTAHITLGVNPTAIQSPYRLVGLIGLELVTSTTPMIMRLVSKKEGTAFNRRLLSLAAEPI